MPICLGMAGAAQTTQALDPEIDGLIEATRARKLGGLRGRGRWGAFVDGGLLVAVAATMAFALPSGRSPSWALVLVLVGAYAFASRVEFEVGPGSAVPTQLVLVPMLFLVPVGTVPLLVAAGLVLGNFVNYLRGDVHLERVPLPLVSAWHAVAPALVLAAAGEPAPSWSDWPLYVAALAAQFGLDFASSTAYLTGVLGISPWTQLRASAWTNVVDLALAPAGLLVAFVAVEGPFTFLLLLPLIGLLDLFARERRARIDHALELSHAYRGTALLLGDVVEADDAYTGSHSRDVVSLVTDVVDVLGLDARERRNAELVAMLHDVGKIRIPGEIINKPGPLTAEERALVETHTIEGERMLAGVGGLLADVGRLVRSCHERFDGKGYPDGLAGDEIPLVARVVCCCDAFSAMTTDRSYRRALPLEDALAELRANAGTQFDPTVVEALITVLDPGR